MEQKWTARAKVAEPDDPVALVGLRVGMIELEHVHAGERRHAERARVEPRAEQHELVGALGHRAVTAASMAAVRSGTP